MIGMINKLHIFIMSDEADSGSAEEQPDRNNLTDWNGRGRVIFPFSKNKKSTKNINIFFNN